MTLQPRLKLWPIASRHRANVGHPQLLQQIDLPQGTSRSDEFVHLDLGDRRAAATTQAILFPGQSVASPAHKDRRGLFQRPKLSARPGFEHSHRQSQQQHKDPDGFQQGNRPSLCRMPIALIV